MLQRNKERCFLKKKKKSIQIWGRRERAGGNDREVRRDLPSLVAAGVGADAGDWARTAGTTAETKTTVKATAAEESDAICRWKREWERDRGWGRLFIGGPAGGYHLCWRNAIGRSPVACSGRVGEFERYYPPETSMGTVALGVHRNMVGVQSNPPSSRLWTALTGVGPVRWSTALKRKEKKKEKKIAENDSNFEKRTFHFNPSSLFIYS